VQTLSVRQTYGGYVGPTTKVAKDVSFRVGRWLHTLSWKWIILYWSMMCQLPELQSLIYYVSKLMK